MMKMERASLYPFSIERVSVPGIVEPFPSSSVRPPLTSATRDKNVFTGRQPPPPSFPLHLPPRLFPLHGSLSRFLRFLPPSLKFLPPLLREKETASLPFSSFSSLSFTPRLFPPLLSGTVVYELLPPFLCPPPPFFSFLVDE